MSHSQSTTSFETHVLVRALVANLLIDPTAPVKTVIAPSAQDTFKQATLRTFDVPTLHSLGMELALLSARLHNTGYRRAARQVLTLLRTVVSQLRTIAAKDNAKKASERLTFIKTKPLLLQRPTTGVSLRKAL